MPHNDFEYGRHAVIAPDQQDRFDSCKENLVADTRPGNFLEQLIVDELLHAQWELHRAEQASGNLETEATLIAASARATRNWQRASRELAALQTARVAGTSLTGNNETVDAPCADLTKIPKRRPATPAVEAWHLDIRTIRVASNGPSYQENQ